MLTDGRTADGKLQREVCRLQVCSFAFSVSHGMRTSGRGQHTLSLVGLAVFPSPLLAFRTAEHFTLAIVIIVPTPAARLCWALFFLAASIHHLILTILGTLSGASLGSEPALLWRLEAQEPGGRMEADVELAKGRIFPGTLMSSPSRPFWLTDGPLTSQEVSFF